MFEKTVYPSEPLFAMKMNHLPPRRTLFLAAAIALISFSCDVLQSDPDLKKSAVQVNANPVYALSKGSTFIDLNSRIKVNQTITFTITSSTYNGNLTHLSNGLLQYSPGAGKGGLKDAFTFTVFGQNSNVLSYDSVVIAISNAGQLPCGIYPVDDSVRLTARTPTGAYQGVFIDVLANDILCDYDSADTEVSVYRPDASYGPHFGIASSGSQPNPPTPGSFHLGINYTPFDTFNGKDQFIYKIQSRSVPSNVAFGIVYISAGPSDCTFALRDDYYTFQGDSVNMAEHGAPLYVFSNDTRCDSIGSYQYTILNTPHDGTATINRNFILYTANDFPVGESRVDTIQYQLCLPQKCLTAKAVVYMKH
jgi:hypothetical protein